jgi:hypothetical protein
VQFASYGTHDSLQFEHDLVVDVESGSLHRRQRIASKKLCMLGRALNPLLKAALNSFELAQETIGPGPRVSFSQQPASPITIIAHSLPFWNEKFNSMRNPLSSLARSSLRCK